VPQSMRKLGGAGFRQAMLQIGNCRVSWRVAGDGELRDPSVGHAGRLIRPLRQAGCPRVRLLMGSGFER
jgi:hypothetical protein